MFIVVFSFCGGGGSGDGGGEFHCAQVWRYVAMHSLEPVAPSHVIFFPVFFPHLSREGGSILCQPARLPPPSFAAPQLQALDRSVPCWAPAATSTR